MTNQPIKIYSMLPESMNSDDHRKINHLLVALSNKMNQEEGIKKYGALAKCFDLCASISESNCFLLPMDWSYYVENNLIYRAAEFVTQGKLAGRPVIIFNWGDFPAKLPFSGVLLFENAGYFSRRNSNGNLIFGLPALIKDYLSLYCKDQMVFRQKGDKPVMGFCGQASSSYKEHLYRELIRKVKVVCYNLGITKWAPPPFETTQFRGNILNTLQKNSLIDTRFILRKKYRAGYQISKKDPHHSTRLEFIQNILNTDYTVCMRGGGNFSVRFYETLCLGRIPVFINTNCLLPFHEAINWKDYFVWVEQDEIPIIAEKVIEFHNRYTPPQFLEVQEGCRRLWKTYFSWNGFYSNLANFLKDWLINNSL